MHNRDTTSWSDSQVLRDLHRRIVGDGSENNPGLTSRVDRLERALKGLLWTVSALAGTLIARITPEILTWFKH